jgi:hypothetical protein
VDVPCAGDFAAVVDRLGRGGVFDLEVGEVRGLLGEGPEGDGALEGRAFEAVDDERGLGGFVEEDFGFAAMDFYAEVGPCLGSEVGPGFVDKGPVAAEVFPAKAGLGVYWTE